ncbi:YesL family protein [Terribacillus halophilus]|uniref:YesL family protein n=1 Tax=Terribacillus halophilus TaxID=361279 RepID=UPI0039825AC6
MAAINKGLEWITRMAYVNILWLIFLLPGLVVFGVFPATAAMLTIIHQWLQGKTDISIFGTFLETYKKEFINSNKLGYMFVLLGYILYLDFLFLTAAPDAALYLTIPFLIITSFAFSAGLYAFPMLVHYEMKPLQIVKRAFFIMMLNPCQTFLMLIGTMGVGSMLWYFQGLALFFSFSILALIIMMPAARAFERMEKKSANLQAKENQSVLTKQQRKGGAML